MADAPRDANFIPTALAWDGTATKVLLADSVTNRLLVEVMNDLDTNTTVSPVPHDGNHKPTLYAVSDADGTTLIPLACTAAGDLLIKLT